MKNILIDISGKIDDSYIEPIIEIKNSAEALNIQFFVIGAFARDIIMEKYPDKYSLIYKSTNSKFILQEFANDI